MLAISYPNHICYFGFMCVQLSAGVKKTGEYENVQVCGLARQYVDHSISSPVRVSIDICSAALCVRCQPVRQVRVSRTASETHVKGTLNELCGVRSILKAMLFEDRQKKGQLPSLFERHPARSGVGTLNATWCHGLTWGFLLNQTISGLVASEWESKSWVMCAAVILGSLSLS